MAEERNIAEELLGKPAAAEAPQAAQEPVKAPEATPQAPAAETPPTPATAPPGYIPLAAMLDDRDKRQKAEARLKELEAKIQQYERQPEPVPSIQTPEDILALVQRVRTETRWENKAEWSEEYARDKHGDETVDKAMEWALEKGRTEFERLGHSPFAQEQMLQRNPVNWVVKAYKRDQRITQVPDDDEAYKAYIEKQARELGVPNLNPAQPSQAAPPQPAPIQPARPMPSKSLASAPSAGGSQTIPTGPGVAFDSAFNR